MATLTGQNIANTYKQLLQIGSDNDGLTASVQTVQDGSGTNSALQLSQSAVNINGTFQLNGTTLTATASALNAVPDITAYTGFIAVSGTNINGRTLTGGTGVSISNADGTEGNPVIALNTTGVTSGTYGPATNFEVNAVGQVVSAGAATSVSVSAVTANTFVGGTFEGTTGNFSSNVSVGGTLTTNVFTPAALSVTGTVNANKISATDGTFNNIVSAAFFVGDGSGLVNVPSSEGGTVKTLTAGPGISLLVNASPSDITVSGTVQLNEVVSVSSVYAAGSMFIAGTSVATIDDVAAVSVLTQTNLNSITSINTVVGNVSAATSVNSAAITSINAIIGDGGNFATSAELATVSAYATSIVQALSATMATSIGNSNTNITTNANAITSINTVVAGVSALTSVNAAAITSINTVVAGVSALTSVNAAAITSINTVVDNLDFATSAELATVSAALATSIGNSNTNITTNANAITSINAILGDGSNFATSAELATVSAALATSIGNSNTNITTNANAITSINTVVAGVSALTSVNAAAITSINTILGDGSNFATSAELATVSAALATSIANHLPLAGGTLTGTVSGTDFYVSAVAIGVDALLGKELHIAKAAVADVVSLTDGASIAVDFNNGQNFAVQLAGNRTLESPTNCVAGQTGSIFIIQDGTGSRTLSYGGNWKFAAATPPTLSTGASAVDRIDYVVYTSTAVHAVGSLNVS